MIELAAIVEWLAAAFLVTRSMCQLNPMTMRTRVWIKMPYILLAASSFVLFVSPIYEDAYFYKQYAYTVAVAAIALLLLVDKRVNQQRPKQAGDKL